MTEETPNDSAPTPPPPPPARARSWAPALLGLGLALAAVGQGIVALGTYPPFLILLFGIAAGLAWSMFGPAKNPKGAEPPKPVEILDTNTAE